MSLTTRTPLSDLFASAILMASSASVLAQGAPEILWDQAAHPGTVSGLAMHPSGQYLATGSGWEPAIRFWSVADGTLLRVIPDYGPVLAFNPDGQTLAAAVNLTVKIWEVADGDLRETVNEFQGGWPPVGALAYSSDGQRLAAAESSNRTKVLETAAYEVVHEFELYSAALAFSPDGLLLASGGQNGFTRLISMGSGQVVRVMGFGDWHLVQALAYSPDGQCVVTGGGPDYYGNPGSVKWWRTADGFKIRQTNHAASVSNVAYSPDGKLLAAAMHDGTLCFWSTADGLPRRTYAQGLGAGGGRIVFAPDGATFACAGGDGRVFVARTPPACPADLNGDGGIGLTDLALLLAHFGTTGGAAHGDGDIDGDQDVDLSDLAQLLAVFGAAC